MVRLSMWKEGAHSEDFRFFDRTVLEQFQIGGVGMMCHKYLGIQDQGNTGDLTQPSSTNGSELAIQDLLLLENRDRKYEPDVYNLRGHYNVADLDMEMQQFGMFISNDNVFMTFHLNDMVERMGRKLMVGDVLELPHLKEFYALDDSRPTALKRFYVVNDTSRAGEGFSATWWPHLWRVKCKPMVDSQEYSQILDQIADDADGNPTNDTLRDLLSTYNQEIQNNAAVIAQAEQEVPSSGYDTSQFYVVNSTTEGLAGDPSVTADSPAANGWTSGYLTGDGLAPNGQAVTSGTSFPSSPAEGEYALRLDMLPNRLFRYSGSRWVKVEDVNRTSLTPGAGQTQRDSFINNTDTTFTDDNQTISQKVDLYKALSIAADNTVPVSVVQTPVDLTLLVPVWVSSADLGSFDEHQVYSNTLQTTSSSTVTYTLQSGSLPPGVTLTAGVLSGLITNILITTTYIFVIRATNTNGYTDQTFNITISKIGSI